MFYKDLKCFYWIFLQEVDFLRLRSCCEQLTVSVDQMEKEIAVKNIYN